MAAFRVLVAATCRSTTRAVMSHTRPASTRLPTEAATLALEEGAVNSEGCTSLCVELSRQVAQLGRQVALLRASSAESEVRGRQAAARGEREAAALQARVVDSEQKVHALRQQMALQLAAAEEDFAESAAAGRATAFFAGLHKKDTPKAWDWCAAKAIGEAAGVAFLRADSDVPFDLSSPSVCAAGSLSLARSLRRTLCEALVSVP